MAAEDGALDGENQVSQPESPVSRLLASLGMTREDLVRHSAQMREFLTTENANSLRALVHSQDAPPPAGSSATAKDGGVANARPLSRAHSTSDASISRTSSAAGMTNLPPPIDTSLAQRSRSYSTVSFKSDTSRRDGKEVKEKRSMKCKLGPTPVKAKPSLDEVMQMRSSRVPRRVTDSPESEDSEDDILPTAYHSRANAVKRSPYYRTGVYSTQGNLESAFAPEVKLSLSLSPAQWNTPNFAKTYYRSDSPTPQTGGVSEGDLRTMKSTAIPLTTTLSTGELPSAVKERNVADVVTPTHHSHYRINYDYSGPVIPSSSPISSSPFPNHASLRSGLQAIEPTLSFELPPGPYSKEKPDLSYAAMIGRAILASPHHRLRLKDIYEYIETVFPYYVRGEGTSHSHKWMNAIRQNLTNTPQFHKLPSESTKGGSYWHIRDEDLPCFANGGYKRSAVPLGNNGDGTTAAPKQMRKRRRDTDDQRQRSKKSKADSIAAPAPMFAVPTPYQYSYQMLANHPRFYHPGQGLPTEQDDLPPSSPPPATPSNIYAPYEASDDQLQSPSPEPGDSSPPPPSSSASLASMPSLTPNCSSSSPPLDSDMSSAKLNSEIEDDDVLLQGPEGDNHRPSSRSNESLAPGFELVDKLTTSLKGKGVDRSLRMHPYEQTDTPTRRKTKPTGRDDDDDDMLTHVHLSEITGYNSGRFEGARPSTPPNPVKQHPVSSIRTPVSHAAKKSGLLDLPDDESKTPSRVLNRSSPPVTPRKFVTPFSFSPFKTPTRGRLFDPHNPSMVLEEELTRLSTVMNHEGLGDSPVGFFAHGKGLLYESPSLPSPAQAWRQTW